ncbi:MAG TPA: hypothetical protein VFA77_16475 [Candidatus Eisenbacteria bacterium]|nr:hypothetical protein [Candidatus Eisenbacteria bacterium]
MLWTLGSIFFRANQLLLNLYYSQDLNVYHYLPIGDDSIFQRQWNKFLRASAWSATDFMLLYGLLALKVGAGFTSPIAGCALGIIQGGFVVAGALSLLMLRARRFFVVLATIFMASAAALLFFGSNGPITEWLNRIAYWLPPIGWIVHGMGITPSEGMLRDLVPCVLAAFVLVAAPVSYRRLHRSYSLTERLFALLRRATPVMGAGAEAQGTAEAFMQPSAEVERAIKSSYWLPGMDWHKARLLEKCAARLLTPREQAVAEFMVAANPRWTESLRGFTVLLLILLGAFWLFAGVINPGAGILVWVGAFFILPIFSVQWRGFTSPKGAGLQHPYYSVYPIAFWELARLVLKINLARFLFYGPILCLALILVPGSLRFYPEFALWAGLKFLALGLLLQPIWVIAQISPGTNDGRRLRILFCAILVILLLGGGMITFAVASDLVILLVSGLITGGTSWLALLFYGWLFNRNSFDLLPAPSTTAQQPSPYGR